MMEPNHIYQFSLANALMDGVCETGITAQQLSRRGGNQGLGTFSRMDGELLMLDGAVYRLSATTAVREAAGGDEIPFAIVTRFEAQERAAGVRLADKADIDRVLEATFAAERAGNLFVTYRVDGEFAHVKCRTVRGQEYAGQPLSELGKKQRVDTYTARRGTIVGFRTPANWQGFGIAGEHLHFISEDRSVGGHVLEVTAESVEVQMAVAANVHLELPTSEDFNKAQLVTDDAAVKKVEG